MKNDKLYQILLELYVQVYRSIGVDFNSIDKEENFFLNYKIDREAEVKLVNDFLSRQKLTTLQKRVIKNSYYLGCSPANI